MKCIKVRNIFSVLTKHKQGLTTATLMALFKTTMRSKVNYGMIAYGSAAKTNLAKIDVVLRRALRLILGAAKSTPVEHLYAELGFEPLIAKREWLSARYATRLGQKPLNSAYGSAFILANGDKKWSLRRSPCLTTVIKTLEQFNLPCFVAHPGNPPEPQGPSPWISCNIRSSLLPI